MMRTREKGFTATEFLVLLAMLVIIFLLLVPANNTLRAKRDRAVCAENLRGIGVGLLAYAQDHHRYLPTAAHNNVLGQPASWDLALLNGYVAGPSLFHCPADRVPRKCGNQPRSYAISGGNNGLPNVLWVFGANLDFPPLSNKTGIVIVTEGWHADPVGPRCVGDDWGICYYNAGEQWPTIASFHFSVQPGKVQTYRKTTHYLFLDGHLEWIEDPAVDRLLRMFPVRPAGVVVLPPPRS